MQVLLTRDQQDSRPSDCKIFPPKTSSLYAQIPFKPGFTVITNSNKSNNIHNRLCILRNYAYSQNFHVRNKFLRLPQYILPTLPLLDEVKKRKETSYI
jgi:hypothetical protein